MPSGLCYRNEVDEILCEVSQVSAGTERPQKRNKRVYDRISGEQQLCLEQFGLGVSGGIDVFAFTASACFVPTLP